MALNTFKCNHLTPLHFKGLIRHGGSRLPLSIQVAVALPLCVPSTTCSLPPILCFLSLYTQTVVKSQWSVIVKQQLNVTACVSRLGLYSGHMQQLHFTQVYLYLQAAIRWSVEPTHVSRQFTS